MKRFAFGIIPALLLVNLLTLTLNVHSVKAGGTIYIKADGSVYPPEAEALIHRDGDVYTFIADINDSIVVERDNIIIDGAGYTLQGTGESQSRGIDLTGRSNVTIKNIVIKNFGSGIWLNCSSNNVISGNCITDNLCGVELSFSSCNIISGNNITANNYVGIDLRFSSYNNSISENMFIDNGLLVGSYPNSVVNNTVNGKPLVYLEGVQDRTISDAGQVILVKCKNIRVEGLNLSRATVGIELLETSNSTIFRNNITNNLYGILLGKSTYNIISGNNITANSMGVSLALSSYNSIFGNILVNNKYGIELVDSSHNNIFGNNIAENTSVGIWLGYSYDNRFWHNNIINTRQLFIHPLHSNVWDDGYPSGGNYWSNYKGVDFYSGQFQNETGSDGVGDTPHVVFVNENNTDRYPLIAPITIFDAGTWNEVSYKIDIISNSTISDFHFNPEEGAYLQFNVTGDDGMVGFCRVTIPKSLLWAENGWNITVGDQPITNYLKFEDENSTYLYFTYIHSTKTVTIQGTHVIPEFPSIAIIPLLIIIPTLAMVLVKKKTARKLKT